ncbi:MAG TPA: hypothetical protein VJB16_04520, partial [archaeon]|nr:hypothetical protein [archaeon]
MRTLRELAAELWQPLFRKTMGGAALLSLALSSAADQHEVTLRELVEDKQFDAAFNVQLGTVELLLGAQQYSLMDLRTTTAPGIDFDSTARTRGMLVTWQAKRDALPVVV